MSSPLTSKRSAPVGTGLPPSIWQILKCLPLPAPGDTAVNKTDVATRTHVCFSLESQFLSLGVGPGRSWVTRRTWNHLTSPFLVTTHWAPSLTSPLVSLRVQSGRPVSSPQSVGGGPNLCASRCCPGSDRGPRGVFQVQREAAEVLKRERGSRRSLLLLRLSLLKKKKARKKGRK